MRPKGQLAALDHFAKDRFSEQQRPSHAEPLGALPGKNKSHLAANGDSFTAGLENGTSLSLPEGGQTINELLRRITGHSQAIIVMSAAGAGAIAYVAERKLGG